MSVLGEISPKLCQRMLYVMAQPSLTGYSEFADAQRTSMEIWENLSNVGG